jgi:hypothetical protein
MSILANDVPYGYTGVQTFPDVQQLTNNWNPSAQNFTGSSDLPVDALPSLTVVYDETSPHGTNDIYEFAPDIWTSYAGQAGQGSGDIMFWADTTHERCVNNGLNSNAKIGQTTLGGQPWTVYRYGGVGGEIVLILDGTSSTDPVTTGTCATQASGSIDVKAGLDYLNAQGLVPHPGAYTISQFNTGWEITSAQNSTFTLNSYKIDTTGGGTQQQAPVVATQTATNVADTTATVNGTVNPEGAATTYQFQYGTSTSYGSTSPATPADAGSGTTAVSESANLTGLTAGTTYHYRIVATNSAGTTNGSDMTFTTTGGTAQQAPAVTTNAASGVTDTAAALNGTVNPEGDATTYQFDYGTTTSYGSSVPVPAGSAGTGTTAVTETANVTGLQPSTTYHYRIEATNSAGTTLGADQTFTTLASGGGGGQVAFDAQGGGHKTGTTPLTWTQNVASGAVLLAEATVGVPTPGTDVGCTQTLTDNGVTMTKLGVIHTNNQHQGFMDVWAAKSPPSGLNTLRMTVSGCSSPALTGSSESFTGANPTTPFGALATAVGFSTSAHASSSAAATGDMLAGFVAAGSALAAPAAPAAHSLIENQNNASGAGNSAEAMAPGTGSAVNFAWPVSPSDWWAVGLVPVKAAAAAPAPSPSPTPTPTPTQTSPSPSPSPTTTGAVSWTCPGPHWSWSTSDPKGGENTSDGFFLYNNMWNTSQAGPQTMCANNLGSEWMVSSNQNNADLTSVKTYPAVQKNYNNVPVGNFTKMTSTFAHQMPAASATYDAEAAYDIWLNGLNKEVMIWTDNHGQTPAGSKVATVTLSGTSWDLFETSGHGYMAFVPVGGAHMQSGSLDLLGFLNYLKSRGDLVNSDQLWQVNYGFEICHTTGPMNFYVTGFTLSSTP